MATVNTTPETNLITQEKMKRVREVDFVRQFQHKSLSKLIEVLGGTRKIPMMEGSTLYYYTTKKRRKAASAEAIKKSGYNSAVRETDAALLRDVQVSVRKDLFDFMNGTISNSTPITGDGLQAARRQHPHRRRRLQRHPRSKR